MIKFYRNLRTGSWSAKTGSEPVTRVHCATLHNITVKHPSGKHFERCLNGGPRKVFAWFKAESMTLGSEPIPDNARRILFNPTSGDTHFFVLLPDDARNGKKWKKHIINNLTTAYALPSGEMYAVL